MFRCGDPSASVFLEKQIEAEVGVIINEEEKFDWKTRLSKWILDQCEIPIQEQNHFRSFGARE